MTELSFLSITGIITSSATFMNVLGAGHGWKIKSSRWWFFRGFILVHEIFSQHKILLFLYWKCIRNNNRHVSSLVLCYFDTSRCNETFFWFDAFFCFVWIDVTSRKAGFKGRYVHVCNAQIVIPTYYYLLCDLWKNAYHFHKQLLQQHPEKTCCSCSCQTKT